VLPAVSDAMRFYFNDKRADSVPSSTSVVSRVGIESHVLHHPSKMPLIPDWFISVKVEYLAQCSSDIRDIQNGHVD